MVKAIPFVYEQILSRYADLNTGKVYLPKTSVTIQLREEVVSQHALQLIYGVIYGVDYLKPYLLYMDSADPSD
jgi:hypothetical protein